MFTLTINLEKESKSTLSRCLFGQKRTFTEATICAHNPETLNEYKCVASLDTDHIPKLQSYVRKNKFNITERSEDLIDLCIGNLFNYQLQKQQKTELNKIKEMTEIVKQQAIDIDRDQKLFQYWFFQNGRVPSAGNTNIADLFYVMVG